MSGGVREMVKRMLEQQAKARADLEAEIAELEPSVAILSSQVIPGLAAGVQGASAHMKPSLLSPTFARWRWRSWVRRSLRTQSKSSSR